MLSRNGSRTPSTTRLLLAAVGLSSVTLGACSSADTRLEPGGAEPVASSSEDLYGLGSLGGKWPNGTVPVCFADMTSNQALRAAIPGMLQSTWTAAANITFTGFGACASSGNQVTVTFVPSTDKKSRGWTSTIGYGTPTVTLISDDTLPNQKHFHYEVVHEFGHALGFVHEMKRPDNWDGGVAYQCGDKPSDSDYGQYSPVSGGIYLTATYDYSSVMNYCNPAGYPTLLSVGDVAGARTAYGVPSGFNGNRAQDGRIAVVSRVPGTMEVFWITSNGAVNDSYWYEGGSWHTFQLAPPGSASTTGRITAVSRVPTSLEVFYIGANGSVQDKYWYDGGSWGGFTLAGAGSASTKGGITAVSRAPNTMEVFYVGADGSVQDKYWYDGGSWNGFTLAGRGSASTTSSLTAVSRVSTSLEVWYVGADGSVQDKYWYDGGSWNGFPLARAGSASLAGGIAAVSRVPSSMELWYIGADGSVQDNYWYDGGSWNGFALAGRGSASTNGGLSAVSGNPSALDVYFIGPDGSVKNGSWFDGGSWSVSSVAGAGSARTTDGVASVSRIPEARELWYTGANGSVQDDYYYQGSSLFYSGFQLAGPGSAP